MPCDSNRSPKQRVKNAVNELMRQLAVGQAKLKVEKSLFGKKIEIDGWVGDRAGLMDICAVAQMQEVDPLRARLILQQAGLTQQEIQTIHGH